MIPPPPEVSALLALPPSRRAEEDYRGVQVRCERGAGRRRNIPVARGEVPVQGRGEEVMEGRKNEQGEGERWDAVGILEVGGRDTEDRKKQPPRRDAPSTEEGEQLLAR